MMEKSSYRLAEYKIIENAYGDIYWETHCGLGSLKKGKCFINGDVLFLEPKHTAAPGFLKGEFLDHLKKLPQWNKTTFYCKNYRIIKCQSKVEQDKREAAATYRLGRYEIHEAETGRITWRTWGAPGRIKEGKCEVNGDILFIGPANVEKDGLMKRQFVRGLSERPAWTGTGYYCPNFAVYHCGNGAICRSFGDKKIDKDRRTGKIEAAVKSSRRPRQAKSPIGGGSLSRGYLKSILRFCRSAVNIIRVLAFGLVEIGFYITRWVMAKWVKFRER